MSKKTANPYELAAESDLMLANERIDRVAKAVDANAAEFDKRLGNLGALNRVLDSRIDKIERIKQLQKRHDALIEQVNEFRRWANDVVAVQRENADAGNTNDEHVFQKIAEVEQLASLTAQRVLKAEGQTAALASQVGPRLVRLERQGLALSERVFALETIKYRPFSGRLRWLFFGE